MSAVVTYVYLAIHNEQTDCCFYNKLGPFEMFQSFFYQFDEFDDVIINGHLKGENAIF